MRLKKQKRQQETGLFHIKMLGFYPVVDGQGTIFKRGNKRNHRGPHRNEEKNWMTHKVAKCTLKIYALFGGGSEEGKRFGAEDG